MIDKLRNRIQFIYNESEPMDRHPDHLKIKGTGAGLDGMFILAVAPDEGLANGIIACNEDSLYKLLLDDDELEYSGYDKYKDKFIADGTITQADIDAEKVGETAVIRAVEIRAAIIEEVDRSPSAKSRYNEIRTRHGLSTRL